MTYRAATRLSRVALVCTLLTPAAARGQIRASEVGSMSQIIDGTKITVEYSRPRSRGRDTIFGTKAVHWDEVWTPGANWATTLDVSKPVTLNGRAVPAGKYAMWMVVKQDSTWTVVLDPKSKMFHMDPPDSSGTQIRFPVRIQAAPFTDILTFSMPEMRVNGGTLAMQWERVRVPIDVGVQPSLSITTPAAEARPFVGEYVESDSAASGPPRVTTLTITYENGTLMAEYTPTDAYMKKFAMIRIAPDWFAPGLYDKNGQLYEVLRPDMIFEFTRVNGRATSFSVRGDDDAVFATGKRKP